jgi:uncharacterized protein with HEPN domain
MPSSRAEASLRDILHHIDLAVGFVADLDYEAFAADLRTIYAVTRCLEIISEASRRLPDDMKARHGGIAWTEMAGAGNVYRDDYEDVAARLVWETVARELAPLRAVVVQELDRLGATGRPPSSEA